MWRKRDDVVIDGLLGSAIEGVLEGAPRDAINNLYKDAQEATVTCECKQNFVNILIFQLLLFMFNLSKIQIINRGSSGWIERTQNYNIAWVRVAKYGTLQLALLLRKLSKFSENPRLFCFSIWGTATTALLIAFNKRMKRSKYDFKLQQNSHYKLSDCSSQESLCN